MKSVKLALCGALAAFALSAPAHAASLLFDFGAGSSISVVENSRLCFPSAGCALSASLELPTGSFAIDEGDELTFNFAKFMVSPGAGIDLDAKVHTDLVFDIPVFNPDSTASSDGLGAYGTFFGIVTGGYLNWSNPIQQFTTSDGSKFTLTFGDVHGLTLGSTAYSPLTIRVDDVADAVAAVPEPATWATMLMGFFAAGGMIRSRRRALAA